MNTFLIIGSIIFVIGSILDASYSKGLKERNFLYRDKHGFFSLTRYGLISAGALAGVWLFALFMGDKATWITSGLAAAGAGVFRLVIGLRTKGKLATR